MHHSNLGIRSDGFPRLFIRGPMFTMAASLPLFFREGCIFFFLVTFEWCGRFTWKRRLLFVFCLSQWYHDFFSCIFCFGGELITFVVLCAVWFFIIWLREMVDNYGCLGSQVNNTHLVFCGIEGREEKRGRKAKKRFLLLKTTGSFKRKPRCLLHSLSWKSDLLVSFVAHTWGKDDGENHGLLRSIWCQLCARLVGDEKEYKGKMD